MFEVYRHYKGAYYVRLISALHSEDLGSYEVYRTLYDNPKSRVWARPSEMFHGATEDGEARFSLIGSVGRAFPEDEAELASFSYETRGRGASLEQFLETDRVDPDTRRGERWFLQDRTCEKVSALNVLRFARRVVGITSVSTRSSKRGQGYESLLIRVVMELIRTEDPSTRFLLFAEEALVMYERLGFRLVPASERHLSSVFAMTTGEGDLTSVEQEILRQYLPRSGI